MYLSWVTLLEPSITLVPVELSGRGRRFTDPLYRELTPLIEDLYIFLKPKIQNCSFAFFGHSMGSLICFELAHLLHRKQEPLPQHLFLSGNNAPHLLTGELDPTLPEEQLITRIRQLGGTPDEVFQNTELRELFLPIILADLTVIHSYRVPADSHPLELNLSILYGREDPLLYPDGLAAWAAYTHKTCRQHSFPGAHMYLDEQKVAIATYIKQTLATRSQL